MLGLGIGGASLFSLARSDDVEMRKRGQARESGIRVCSGDLPRITGPVSVESLLIESGIVEASKLRELLGRRGLKFVELRAHAVQDGLTKENTYGVVAFRGDQSSFFGVARDVKIVRVGLSRKGDAACTSEDILDLRSFPGAPPTAPDACLRVDFDEQSRASHALRALPAASDPAFIKWALVEQASGKVLASLTSSDDALHPSRQGGGEEYEHKAIADDIVHCRSPHFSLMNLVYGREQQPDERLSLGQQQVRLDIAATEPGDPLAWDTVAAREEAVDHWEYMESARHGPAWQDAYRIAAQSGWAGYEEGLIDFKAGVIVVPRPLVKPDLRVRIRGTQQGFMAAWSSGNNRVALAQFGLDGRLSWKRQIMSTLPVEDVRARFELVGMEWGPREVRLYGFRQYGGAKGADVRVLTVPLSRPDGLPRGASSGRKGTLQ